MVLLGALLRGAIAVTASSSPVTARDVSESKHTPKLLTILSLVFASISVVSTLSTLYWFVKMRRSFRHELIMLLIQSDFLKSAAFIVFPIVTLVRGTVESNSAFCQISGFSLAVGIESADVAVLLIAVHSVMYIFRPRSGLYPYRRTAYLVYYLFPLAMGGLAFVDGTGYQNVGHYCYLRTDNGWARMALNWVPRYIVGLSIVVIYAFVYLYVRKRMGDYGRRSSMNMPQPSTRGYRDDDVPPTPPIAYHGLLHSAPGSRRGSAAESIAKVLKRSSLSSVSTIQMESPYGHGSVEQGNKTASRHTRPIHWNRNWSGFDKKPTSSSSAILMEDDLDDPLSPNLLPISSPPPVHSPSDHHRQSILEDPSDKPLTPNLHRPVASSYATGRRSSLISSNGDTPRDSERRQRHVSLPTFIPIIRKNSSGSGGNGPPEHRMSVASTEHTTTTTTATTSSSLTTTNNLPIIALPSLPLLPPPTETSPILLHGSTFGDDSNITKNREKIRRQLRSLIVYPLAYLFIWAFPFASHVMGYDDSVNASDPRWLQVVSIISLCVQGTVDSLLFAVREKPWRYARGRFWDSVGKRVVSSVNFWTRDGGWGWRWRGDGVLGGGAVAGRTREEMLVDGRLARVRREEEVVLERERKRAGGGKGNGGFRWSLAGRRSGGREWWDVAVEGDGAWTDDEDGDGDGEGEGGCDGREYDGDGSGSTVSAGEEVSQHLG